MECIKRKSLLNLQNIGQKNLYTPNKRKMFNLELPQKSCSVIRKLPISSLNDLSVSVKKLKMSDEEIEDMVTRDKYYCPSDSVEDLLSGSDDEISQYFYTDKNSTFAFVLIHLKFKIYFYGIICQKLFENILRYSKNEQQFIKI